MADDTPETPPAGSLGAPKRPDTPAPQADWREGLEQVGTCPHCGVAVFVRPADVNGKAVLPTPIYLCTCRHLSALGRPAQPASPVWSSPVLPPVTPDDPPGPRVTSQGLLVRP